METTVRVDENCRLWVQSRGDEHAVPVLLVMGANTSGLGWPERFVDELAERYRVVRYDHRDTGRSSRVFDEHPYAIRDLATDAVAVLDALDIERAHVVGMSMGGVLVQLLLLDHPHRLRSATLFGSAALGAQLAGGSEEGDGLPGVDPRLLAMWERIFEQRSPEEELAWRVEHWRLLNGDVLEFDPDWFRELERRIMAHSGTHRESWAHASADTGGLDRGDELIGVTTPTLVIEAPEDPVAPPPHAEYLARALGGAKRVEIPGMGHALGEPVLGPLVSTIRRHVEEVEAERRG
ncbi:alpha/beta fold hydrolase [Actinopolyspora mortivallis]|uniref:alpha/beta fold hydrolase n=1 Tax=Actinopolyspora mortivallis TaxID=33906 RepID=UPI0021590C9C|nr:alpha/beta hydrolase [Actinopolyspora mortivallis]